MNHLSPVSLFLTLLPLLTAVLNGGVSHAEDAPDPWWQPAWTQRAGITFDTSGDGAGLADAVGTAAVLVRLHEGNFRFAAAREDGSDIRFIAADGKTVLPHQIEKYDGLLNEAFVWVRLPEVKPATKETFHVYYGNQDPAMEAGPKPADVYDDKFALVLHCGERGTPPADATANANNAETVTTTSDGSIIGSGLLLSGTAPVTVPAKPSLQWQPGQAFTLALWVKPTTLQPKTIIADRSEGANAFRLLLEQGVPVLEISVDGTVSRSQPGAPVAAAKWSHLAVVADGPNIRLFVDGAAYSSATGPVPALNSPLMLGGPAAGGPVADATPLAGEMDEITLSNIARPAGWVKLAAVNQGGTDAAQRTLSLAQSESGEGGSHSGIMEHLSLFGDIANNMMFDGWMAIGVCVIMIIVGWTVAIRKFLYLNSIDKGTKVFLAQWKSLSTDLTALNTEDASSVKSLGGQVAESELHQIHKSPLFHIYQIGSDEIRHRLDKDNTRVNGLTGRSIQAIRASLDAGLVHETHRLTDGLIYLTISIAGGPYVGLLGTVVGVMITFAIIAKSGEVNVNSIAPGIASALLATVVGLVVAIPALFIYSYLNSRIKNALSLMQVFIDEFVAKMAEFYRPPNEPDAQSGGKNG
jgi:biopolymer transport protein ExbB